jgi:hypothetical protein
MAQKCQRASLLRPNSSFRHIRFSQCSVPLRWSVPRTGCYYSAHLLRRNLTHRPATLPHAGQAGDGQCCGDLMDILDQSDRGYCMGAC